MKDMEISKITIGFAFFLLLFAANSFMFACPTHDCEPCQKWDPIDKRCEPVNPCACNCVECKSKSQAQYGCMEEWGDYCCARLWNPETHICCHAEDCGPGCEPCPLDCYVCIDHECKTCQEAYGQCCTCVDGSCEPCKCWDKGADITGDIIVQNAIICETKTYTSTLSTSDYDHWHADCFEDPWGGLYDIDANVPDSLVYSWSAIPLSNPQAGTFIGDTNQSSVTWKAPPCKGFVKIQLTVDDKPDPMDYQCPGGGNNRNDDAITISKAVMVSLPAGGGEDICGCCDNSDCGPCQECNENSCEDICEECEECINDECVDDFGPCGPSGGCTALTDLDWFLIHTNFENIDRCNACLQAPADGTYNCIAWTVGVTDRWIWDEVDYIINGGDGDGHVYVDDFEGYYNQNGYPAIVYAESVFDPTHGAIPLSNNCASSKCGDKIRIRHDRNEMEGGVYGYIYDTYNEQR